MDSTVVQNPKPIQQNLRYYLPRWMVVIGLLEGAFGGLVFASLQRWWNPRDSRVMRIKNYVAAIMIVGIGSLVMMTAINS